MAIVAVLAVVPVIVVGIGGAMWQAMQGGVEGMGVVHCGGGDTAGKCAPFGYGAIHGGGYLLEGVAIDVGVAVGWCRLLQG